MENIRFYKFSLDCKTLDSRGALTIKEIKEIIKAKYPKGKIITGTFTTFDLARGASLKMLVHGGKPFYIGQNLTIEDLSKPTTPFGVVEN